MNEFDERLKRQFGLRVRRRRQYVELSQEALAERAGLNRTQMSLYETGRRMPMVSSLVKLAAALEVSVDQLLVGIEWVVVAGPPLRRRGEEDPWEPRQDGDRVTEEA
jgi:transcriptional regulator with XRE-family HTH domain